ncbi:MAG: hypothetical protein L3J84_08955 [Gammaproteobacteria bacterium]|nr:hypothetical protein [Gammaproteobacteria bacterium]
MKKYRKRGVTALITTNYKGTKPQLGKKQINYLCKALEEHIYLTTSEVIKYAKDKFCLLTLFTLSTIPWWLVGGSNVVKNKSSKRIAVVND